MRAVRTATTSTSGTSAPDRWPAGDPQSGRRSARSATSTAVRRRTFLLDRRDDPEIAPYFRLATDKRPAEELYDLGKDPQQMRNLAGRPRCARCSSASARSWIGGCARPPTRARRATTTAGIAFPTTGSQRNSRPDRLQFHCLPRPAAAGAKKYGGNSADFAPAGRRRSFGAPRSGPSGM